MAIASATLGAAEPFLIQQDWGAYTREQHAIWAELVGRRMPQIEAHACEEYLQGFEQIGLRTDLIPNLADVNQRLRPRSGWRATPVSGFLPPDAFFAMDGLLETFLTVLAQMEIFPAAIAAENERNLPFLATTTILMEAVKHGAGRETAHAAIKEHALAAAKALRSGGTNGDTDLLARIAGDKRVGLGKKQLQAILAESSRFVGAAPHQVDAFMSEVKPLARKYPQAATYRPGRLL